MFARVGVRAIVLALLALCWSGCGADEEGQGTPSEPGSNNEQVDDEPDEDDEPERVCAPRAPQVPTSDYFVDISDASGMRVDNYVLNPSVPIPINDHSRLGFVDLNGDGFDDIVAHSLFPNPQAGVPFEHLVFLNNGDGTFDDHSDASGLRGVQAGFFAYGDMDNDGDQDIFAGLDVPLPGQSNRVFLNDGSGVFTEKTGAGVESLGQMAATAAFLDFDSDGILDLYVGMGQTSFRAPDNLLKGRGDGTFEDVTELLVGNRAVPSNGSVVCDYDNDGDLDIFVSTYSVSTQLGANILYENTGDGFEDVAVARGFASLSTGNYFLGSTNNGRDDEPDKGPGEFVGSNGFGIECADINNDGLMDIYLATISHPVNQDYLRKWSDPTQLLINQGAEQGFAFVNEYLKAGLPFNEGDIDAGVVDFDNDGRLDLSVTRDNKYERNYTGVDQKSWFGLMYQRSNGTFASFGPLSGINATEAENSASLTECTDDAQCSNGEACLADRCRIPCTDSTQCPTDQEICHTGGFCRLLVTMKKGQNLAWSDIDRDGDFDLLVGGRDAGGGRPNFLFRNDLGHQNRWIAFEVEGDGDKVNRDGVGTRISLRFEDRTLSRELHTSRGTYNSSDMRALHFGLGELPCEYTIEVRWPDGTVVEIPSDKVQEESYQTLRYPDIIE